MMLYERKTDICAWMKNILFILIYITRKVVKCVNNLFKVRYKFRKFFVAALCEVRLCNGQKLICSKIFEDISERIVIYVISERIVISSSLKPYRVEWLPGNSNGTGASHKPTQCWWEWYWRGNNVSPAWLCTITNTLYQWAKGSKMISEVEHTVNL